MNDRPLGRTGISISAIGLGCWQFSEGKGLVGGYWPALPPEEVRAIVQASLDGGVGWFDTAEAYGGGASEAALARALAACGKRSGDVVIATKWLPFFRRARSIEDTIDARLSALGGFAIDLHQIHNARGALSSHGALLDAMARLVERKKIRAVGISNFDARQMRRAHAHLAGLGVPLASNQMRYSLLDRRIEANGVMEAAKELGVTIIAYSPLAQGLLSGKFHEDPARVRAVAGPRKLTSGFRARGLAKSGPVVGALRRLGEKHGATPSQVALAWLVTFHGDTVVAIPGASRAQQAKDNAGALRVALSKDELAELDDASRPFLR